MLIFWAINESYVVLVCYWVKINVQMRVKVSKFKGFLSHTICILFVRKDWGDLQQLIMFGFKDGGGVIVPVVLEFTAYN